MRAFCTAVCLVAVVVTGCLLGQAADAEREVPAKPLPVDPKCIRVSKEDEVWIDEKRKTVIVAGQVCNDLATLEMFACPRGTKEHEAVVSVNSTAQAIHAALLAVGAEPGSPARFDPKYEPPTGSEIGVWVVWDDDEGTRQRVPGQQWVKHVPSGKAMTHKWVFAGSGFSEPFGDEKPYYLADAGDLICVSNFTSAMLDLTIPSSQNDGSLLFQSFSENVPPVGTPIQLELKPIQSKVPHETRQ